jgi:hypothetical protein
LHLCHQANSGRYLHRHTHTHTETHTHKHTLTQTHFCHISLFSPLQTHTLLHRTTGFGSPQQAQALRNILCCEVPQLLRTESCTRGVCNFRVYVCACICMYVFVCVCVCVCVCVTSYVVKFHKYYELTPGHEMRVDMCYRKCSISLSIAFSLLLNKFTNTVIHVGVYSRRSASSIPTEGISRTPRRASRIIALKQPHPHPTYRNHQQCQRQQLCL